jgi:hypothetical protein
MKTLYRALAVGSLFAATMMAQRPFGALTSSTPPDPATVVANQVTRLTSLLTLTSAQQTQATNIFTTVITAVTPLQTTLQTDRTSLQAAVQSNTTATIDTLSSSIGTLTGQIVDIQSKGDAAFYAILTTAQQTTLNSSGGFGGRGGFGPGPGGPPRGIH